MTTKGNSHCSKASKTYKGHTERYYLTRLNEAKSDIKRYLEQEKRILKTPNLSVKQLTVKFNALEAFGKKTLSKYNTTAEILNNHFGHGFHIYSDTDDF